MSNLSRLAARDPVDAASNRRDQDPQALAAAWRRQFGADAAPLLALTEAELESHDPHGQLALTRAVRRLVSR